jgi:hypothetical protein
MVSTKPRFTASRAKALWLQCVIGTPLPSGGSQARMAQICSGVKVGGGRGASVDQRQVGLAAPTPPPAAHRLNRHPQPARAVPVADPIGGQQDDLGA